MSNEPDEVNSGALATIVVVLAFSVLAIALVVTSLVRDEVGRLRGQTSGEKVHPLQVVVRELKMSQVAELSAAPKWVDREKGVVSVPIDRASELVLEAIRANPYALSPGNDPEKEEADATTAPESAVVGADSALGAEGAVDSENPAPGDSPEKPEGAKQKPESTSKPATPSSAGTSVAPAPAGAAPTTPKPEAPGHP
jgi:hypothetical protein